MREDRHTQPWARVACNVADAPADYVTRGGATPIASPIRASDDEPLAQEASDRNRSQSSKP